MSRVFRMDGKPISACSKRLGVGTNKAIIKFWPEHSVGKELWNGLFNPYQALLREEYGLYWGKVSFYRFLLHIF